MYIPILHCLPLFCFNGIKIKQLIHLVAYNIETHLVAYNIETSLHPTNWEAIINQFIPTRLTVDGFGIQMLLLGLSSWRLNLICEIFVFASTDLLNESWSCKIL